MGGPLLTCKEGWMQIGVKAHAEIYRLHCAGLGSTAGNLDRFRESELIHSRWAMAGAAGVLAVELAGQGNWYDAPLWVRLSSREAEGLEVRVASHSCTPRAHRAFCASA